VVSGISGGAAASFRWSDRPLVRGARASGGATERGCGELRTRGHGLQCCSTGWPTARRLGARRNGEPA